MKFSLIIHPCILCLATCPHCKHQPLQKRQRQAEAALKLLKEMFPGLVPEEPDGPNKT